ncbi:hypothetical protein BDZ89DRAFT_1110556 [Hymenopellis radicata]|nr:hypothetical protein BDZ89DRAFT_1110556 [Hymenopellis radicata]
MSRFDNHKEFDSPPGLGYMRGSDSINGMQAGTSPSSYSAMDRRTNGATGGYQLYASSVPRPMNAPDWEERSWEGPNRSNPAAAPSSSFSLYNHHHPSPPPSSPLFSLNERVDRNSDRDTYRVTHSPISAAVQSSPVNTSRSTIWWGELEPWMDEEYAKQVCALMGWDPVTIKVPHPTPDPSSTQHANNPGYCFLTFPSPAHAQAVLAQVNATNGAPALTMPNSTKPFVFNWAASVPSAITPVSPAYPVPTMVGTPQYPKEYSIFVGDLAPETSNSDLVAVFRNPVLGLRSDREPKFIRPFVSCKSAKIMLDPVTGVSRGYGFVRFTDEADQQRALVEMHGLYCLSRPMRISPATAKFKPTTIMAPHDLPVQFPSSSNGSDVTVAVPITSLSTQVKSVSAPIAAANSHSSLHSASSGSSSSIEGSSSGTTLSSHTSASSGSLSSNHNTTDDMMNLPIHALAQIAKEYAEGVRNPPKPNTAATSITSQFAQDRSSASRAQDQRYFSEESWKHHAQAQAILGNLIGPNGEQLTSTDPYNTTVFVGGLSPLISEETLRTFFAPFGDIHYVKVPVGKHCGFVQFVRKADAERAIEKMQGFPVGGSRIRLSWGRSQYKAAQAAAQAAQSAAIQPHVPNNINPFSMTPEQLQSLQLQMKMAQMAQSQAQSEIQLQHVADQAQFANPNYEYGKAFSPFSPEPNSSYGRRDSFPSGVPFSSRGFPASWYRNEIVITSPTASTAKGTPTTTRPGSASRYGSYLGGGSPPGTRAPGRSDNHISRPPSGQPDVQELDAMHDLNGTLASLDLDRDRPWKSPAESSDSGASVQFQLTMNPTSSP